MEDMTNIQYKNTYNNSDTNLIKGLAIIAMILHHFIHNNPRLTIFELNSINIINIIAMMCKVCVPLFTIMSGYGLAERYKNMEKHSIKKAIKFSVSHYISFFSTYICVYLIMLFLKLKEVKFDIEKLFGEGWKIGINVILDLLGIRSLFVDGKIVKSAFFGDWFVATIIILYFSFPLIWKLVMWLKYVFLMIAYVPFVVAMLIGYSANIEINYDKVLFCIFAFGLGIIMSQKNALSIIKNEELKIRKIMLMIAILLLFIALRLIIAIPADSFVACILIMLCTYVVRGNGVKRILTCLGKYSANIWLINVFLISIIKPFFKCEAFGFIMVITVGFSFSFMLEKIKEKSNYKEVIKRIRKIVES